MTNTRMTRGKFLQKKLWHPLSRPGALEFLRKEKGGLDPHNAWLMQGVNELNALLRGGRKAQRKFVDSMRQFHIKRQGRHLLDAVSHALERGGAEILPSKHKDTCRDWPSTIVYTLVSEHRFGMRALMNLQTKIERDGISFIPTLKIACDLRALQFVRHETIEPRDQYDVTRISCALPYSDILITDGGKAHAIRELRLDEEFNVEVFSTKANEYPALLSRIRGIAS